MLAERTRFRKRHARFEVQQANDIQLSSSRTRACRLFGFVPVSRVPFAEGDLASIVFGIIDLEAEQRINAVDRIFMITFISASEMRE